MSYRFQNIIIGLGVSIAVLPALGIPHSIEEVLYVIVGAAVAVLGFFATHTLKDLADILFGRNDTDINAKRQHTHQQFNNESEHERDQQHS